MDIVTIPHNNKCSFCRKDSILTIADNVNMCDTHFLDFLSELEVFVDKLEEIS